MKSTYQKLTDTQKEKARLASNQNSKVSIKVCFKNDLDLFDFANDSEKTGFRNRSEFIRHLIREFKNNH